MKFKKRNRAQKANEDIPVQHLQDGTAVYANRFVEHRPGVFRDIKLLKEQREWREREKKRLERKYAQETASVVEGEKSSEGTEGVVTGDPRTLVSK